MRRLSYDEAQAIVEEEFAGEQGKYKVPVIDGGGYLNDGNVDEPADLD